MFGAFDVIGRLKRGFTRGWEAGRCRQDSVRRRPPHLPHLEALEERRVPSGYTITNMGSLGGTYGVALDINSLGAAVGASWTTNNLAENAFLYRNGKMTNLGTLGGPNSTASGINDSGEIVGASMVAPSFAQNDVFLIRHGHMTDLGAIGSRGPFGHIKINNRGDIIGFKLGNGDAALDRRGTMIDLGSLAGLGSAARDLNDNGQVVGSSPVPGPGSPVVHAFLYSNGKMFDLGTLGGKSSEANDINKSREVVGTASIASGAYHAFLYNHGGMTDLGTLGGPNSDAAAINDLGDVVGFSNVNTKVSHGFLYRNGRMTDLNSLIPANSGFVVVAAEDINNRGQIAAEAVSTNPLNHSVYPVLLNPTKHGR
jgi:probable HAF family extracellular repeat protein